MESNLEVFNKIRKDVEEKLNEQLSCVLKVGYNTNEITKNIDTQKIEDEVWEKYKQPIEPVEVKFSSDNEELWMSLNLTDYEDYDKISQNLSNNKSTATHIRTLEKLSTAYVIDTKQKSWMSLSRNLQQCLISSNDEVFQNSLKVHHKIVSTPNASSEGFLNLIQALILMVNNEFFKNSQVINESNKIHRRTLSIIKLILKSQNVLLKNWLHTKQKMVEEVLITFVYMLNHAMGCEQDLRVLDFISMLDSEAVWFKKFCYSLQTRNIILSCLKKTYNLTMHIFSTFLDYLKESSEQSRSHRQFLNFSHSANFLSEYLIYKQGISNFPFKLKTHHEVVTFENFVVFIVSKVNSWNESPRRSILIRLLKSILLHHNNLILNLDIQNQLFQPFNLKNIDKSQLYSIVERNSHILQISNNIFNSQYSKFIVNSLSGFRKAGRRYKRTGSSNELYQYVPASSSRKSREKHNFPQIIVNVTVACIRNFVNKSESKPHIDKVLFELIDCCRNVFDASPQTFTFINSGKLLISLTDFYKTVMNHNEHSIHCKSQIAASLCFFIEGDFTARMALEGESGFLHEIVSNALANTNSLCSQKTINSKLILSIANYKDGSSIIASNHDLLIKCFLTSIWTAENEEENLNLKSNLELKSYEFFHFLHALSYSFKAIQALLCYENEGTIVENQERPLALAELIESCLEPNCSGIDENVIGLTILKIVIANADILLYLQNNYKLQEHLIELQVNSRVPHLEGSDVVSDNYSPSSTMLIDECSSLRHNVLLSIKYTGKVDPLLNEKLVGHDRLLTAPYQSSSAFRRYHKGSNELQKFLHDTRNGLHDHSWLLHVRRAFKTSCKERYKVSIIADLSAQIPKAKSQTNLTWPSTNADLFELFPEEHCGVTIIVRFGIQNGILLTSVQNEENLTLLLRQSRTFLNYKTDAFVGFDWFVGITYLICSGNLDKCKMILLNIISTPVAPLLWPAINNVANYNIHDLFYRQLEIILEDTTKLSCALQSLDVSARHIVKKWLGHCFFTILDFSEICNFVAMTVIYPPEYVLFFVLALFEHIRTDIFTATHEYTIRSILKITKVQDFHMVDYFNFMEKLSKQYRNVL